MKIKLFKKENNFRKKNFAFNPNLYWEIAVFVTLIIVVLSFFFGYRLFMRINQEPASLGNNTSGQVPTINKDRLEKDLNYFSERVQKSVKIISSPAPLIDPSL